MINNIEIEGRVTEGYNDAPAVREITKKSSGEIAGYGCQIEFKPERGTKAFIQVTDWNPKSAMASAKVGDVLKIKGALDQDSWKDEATDNWRRKFTIAATTVERA